MKIIVQTIALTIKNRMNFLNWKLAIRNILKEKRTSFFNLIGLSVGFTFAMAIFIYVQREFTYDNFHEYDERIFIHEWSTQNDGSTDIGRTISISDIENYRKNIPGIENIAFLNYSYFDWDNGSWIDFEGEKYNLERMAFTDSNFNKVFTFKVKSGNINAALADPNSLVLTESISNKIFKDKNPIGQVVKLNDQIFRIQAVLMDLPQNSSIWFSGLLNYKASQKFIGYILDDYSYLPFFLINANVDKQSTLNSINELFLSSLSKEHQKRLKDWSFSSSLIPLRRLYFHEAVPFDPIKHGNHTMTWIILFIGILILSLAVINYINLAIAGSLKWSRDLAIQKVYGSGINFGLKQLIVKSIIICSGAFIISLVLLHLIVPYFNKLIDYPLQLPDFLNIRFISAFILLMLIIAIVSGGIPGILFENLSPVKQMRGDIAKGIIGRKIWKNLLVFQLVISITLISGSLIIYKQVMFSLKENLGININNMIILPIVKLENDKKAFIDKVKSNQATISHCLSSTYLNLFNNWGGKININGSEKDISYLIIHANEEFLPTLNLKVLEGRNFLNGPNSDANSYIINESAKAAYGIANIEEATMNGRPIVGVVNDFNLKSFQYTIEPAAIWKTSEKRTGYLTVHFKANNRQDISNYLSFLNNTWQDLRPDKPFEYEFLDDRLRDMYKNEITLMKAILSFSAIAIFISCLGLLGLISFITEMKTKEIGIRKVNGAKIKEVMVMLNKDFVKWVAIAFVIACPIAWYAMHKWLENFAYKTEMSWWIFTLAGILALGIALLTVSWQSWRAARRNPVEALRYE